METDLKSEGIESSDLGPGDPRPSHPSLDQGCDLYTVTLVGSTPSDKLPKVGNISPRAQVGLNLWETRQQRKGQRKH